MKYVILVYFSILVVFMTIHMELYAQKKKNRFLSQEYLQKDISTFSQSDLFEFPNVNKIPYYFNKKELSDIISLERKKDWKQLYPVLRKYVKKFGIENFYKDTYWIWRLAKLTEQYGNMNEAILLYKLVLKHHREDINIAKIELHYDSLIQDKKDYYVPIEYYYELVEFRKEVDTLRPPRGVLLNMGKEINSQVSDYGPTLNVNDNILIFTSKRSNDPSKLDDIRNEDLYFSKRSDGFWSQAEPFMDINTEYNEGSACLSRDGKTLFFTRCYSPESYGDCDIFIAELQADSTWGNIRNLGINVNSKAWDSHPSLNHSEDTLYFASDRIGGFGLSDIYFTYKNKDGSWAKALNAGPIINTRNNEISPFYHHIHDVLYFSSNGHTLNFGEFDIYKTYRHNNNWGEPKNIGPLVNREGSEFYFTIDSQSTDLFYSRSKQENMNNLDLYSFPLPMEAQPGATTKLYGTLTDEETKEPFQGIVSIIDLDNGIEVAPKFLRPDGTFEFDLINNNNYLLIIKGEEFLKIEELFYLDGNIEYIHKTNTISSKIEFESIVFGNGEAELTNDMFDDLDKISEFLLDNPEFKLKISGHTDSDGREEFNLNLSQQRADAIKEYIVYFGSIEPERITARGYGSSEPIVEERSEADKELNRRVEFELLKFTQNQ